ncbi:MAG: ABC transporter ATP-binding protein [Deltaproteobacteria bacterium]|nr:ABC transporter ATP-binding protein [Deltaproteobacteria bacterium]
MGEALLKVENMSIRFGGVNALQNVAIEVEKGSIHALIGPNGAGKTTLLNCISRVYKADSGKVTFKGKDITHIKPYKVVNEGIARTFQNIELFANVSVMDNMLLGCHSRRKTGFFQDALFWGKARDQEHKFRKKVEEIIDFLDLQAYRMERINNVPYGIQKNVELGRALVMEPELLLLDEPSSGLNVEETQDLAFWLEDIRAEFGMTILLIEHDMRLVMDVSDRITALNYGKLLADGKPKDVVNHPEVVKAYLGED